MRPENILRRGCGPPHSLEQSTILHTRFSVSSALLAEPFSGRQLELK